MRWKVLFWLIFSAVCHAELEWVTKSVVGKTQLGDNEFVAHYRFKNTGRTEVKIVSVRTSCGCTEAQANKEIFLPGESGEITAVFSIGKRTGVHAESITVELAGAESTKLAIKVTIPSAVTFSPPTLVWKSGESAASKQTVAAFAKGISPRLIRAVSNDPRLSVKLESAPVSGKSAVTITPKTTDELIRSTVTVFAEDSAKKPLTFLIYVWVR